MMWTTLAISLLLDSGCVDLDDGNQQCQHVQQPKAPIKNNTGNEWRLIWQDEFDKLDHGKWQHEITAAGGGNNEFQLYTQDGANSFVKDGKLFIKPTLLADSRNPQTGAPYGHGFMSNGDLDVAALYGHCTNSDSSGCKRTGANGNIPPVMSARLRTFERFNFTWGRVVISAKMPVGDWLRPAIWMLPERWVYGDWPRSGEIDIVKAIGNRDLKTTGGEFIGIQKMGSTLHWGPAPDDNKWEKTHLSKHADNWNYGDNFHSYIFEWSTNGLKFFIDDENQALLEVPYPLIDHNPGWRGFWEWGKPWKASYTNPWAGGSNLAPFDQAFHFILNVAVGGTNGFIPDGCVNSGGDPKLAKPWSNGDSYVSAMKKFYDSRDAWKKTWDDEGDNNALQVEYIRVYQRK